MSVGLARIEWLVPSLLAALAWLLYVWRRCGQPPPSPRRVAAAFALGALSPLGVFGVHALLQRGELPFVSSLTVAGSAVGRLAYFTVVVGFVEEAVLLAAVLGSLLGRCSLQRPVHGAVLSSAAALGFAAVENARYAGALGTDVLVGRAVLSTLGHLLISMVWGLALGMRCSRRAGGWGGVGTALALAAVLHGVYDTFLYDGHVWPAVAMLAALWPLLAVAAGEAGIPEAKADTGAGAPAAGREA